MSTNKKLRQKCLPETRSNLSSFLFWKEMWIEKWWEELGRKPIRATRLGSYVLSAQIIFWYRLV